MTSATIGSTAIRQGRPVLRYLLVALSLANLLFFPAWQTALHYSNEYYYDSPAADRAIAAVAINVLLLAALLWAAAVVASRTGGTTLRTLARGAFLVSLLIPLNHIRTNLGGGDFAAWTDGAGKIAFVLAAGLIAVGVYITLRGGPWVSRVAQLAVLIFLPYAVLTFGQGAWVLLGGRDGLFHQGPLAPAVAANLSPERPRVLWLIFDQLDQEMSFETRPTDILLPAFDALRQEAFTADNAYAPAGWTMVSLPALLTGRLVERAKPASANELWLKFPDQPEAERWGRQPNIFSRARERGLNTAVVGNYHPYCRILNNDLVSCYSVSYRQGVPDICGSIVCEAGRQVVGLAYRLPLMDRVPWVRDHYHALNDMVPEDEIRAGIARYRSIHEWSLRLATDPTMDLVFVHYPVPHGPVIFNRRTNDFLRMGETAERFDNMVLADRTLAELRLAMERAGLWHRTAVIISADHGEKDIPGLAFDAEGNRIERRVPFIVKLPSRNTAARYSREMNTIVTQDLILAVLDGVIAGEDDLAAWLDRHVRFGKSPVFPGNEG